MSFRPNGQGSALLHSSRMVLSARKTGQLYSTSSSMLKMCQSSPGPIFSAMLKTLQLGELSLSNNYWLREWLEMVRDSASDLKSWATFRWQVHLKWPRRKKKLLFWYNYDQQKLEKPVYRKPKQTLLLHLPSISLIQIICEIYIWILKSYEGKAWTWPSLIFQAKWNWLNWNTLKRGNMDL